MSVLVLCLLVVGCVSVAWAGDTGAVSLAELQAYAKQYHKKYAPTEVRLRQRMLYNSRKEISALKKKHPLAVFELGVLSDRTPEEMKSMKGYKKMKESPPAGVLPQTPSTTEIPKAFDWRKKGAVTPVKNQGTCGSCWAFSATEGVESAWFLAGNNLTVLSPQQIVSCDSVDDGCFGGDLPPAFNYVKNNGMETAAAYPYHEPYDPWDWFCHYDESKVVAHISGFGYATRDGNETQMQAESLKHGPLSVCVATDGWQSYSGGVMKRGCGSSVDHCVQIVGWDSTSDGTPYWIVRNSWAADWGIDGFIWIERNEDECQIAGEATYAII